MTQRGIVLIGYSSAILAAALFGSVSTLSKPVVSTIDPILLSSLVYIISGLTFTPIAQKTSITKVQKKYYYLVLIAATIGAAVAPFMFFTGLKQSTATDTALLSNGETVFSILFALLFFKEKLKVGGYVAVGMILIGVFVVTTNFHFDSTTLKFNSGNILVIAATALWGLDNNISKIITRHMHVSKLVQLKSLIGGGISLLVLFVMGIPFSIQYSQIIPIVLVGVFGFGISLYLYLHGIKRIGVVKASVLLSLAVVFGLIFASLFSCCVRLMCNYLYISFKYHNLMNQLQIVTVAAISLAALTGLLTVHEAYAMSHITGNTTNASSMMAGNMTGDNQTMMAGNMTGDNQTMMAGNMTAG